MVAACASEACWAKSKFALPLSLLEVIVVSPIVIVAEAGKVVLFESWMRHEVPPNPLKAERISISFNYSWF